MATTPITLAGDDLGQRHRHFNTLVSVAHASGITPRDAENLPENCPIDRLFKIDLASKLKNVDYIIRNLKEDDMLYVSRSLKAKWLLDPEYRSIINPQHLEEVLFPHMIAPAISKMKHWLYINLRDAGRCAEFYEYYKEKNFDYAIKFLCNVSIKYILEEYPQNIIPKILSKITPHYLKIFCEKSPEFARIYYDAIVTDREMAIQYCRNDRKYYNSIKCVLKSDPSVFLDIIEKTHIHKDLSPSATEYIVRHCKRRFMDKVELYAAKLLHMPTIAKNLSVEECEEVILKLARANYISSWFSYKNVEPLVKRLSPDRRAAFKKRVFVDKDVGECVDQWPYPTPMAPPIVERDIFHVFDDIEIITPGTEDYLKYEDIELCCADVTRNCLINRQKTELDRLFDAYRFIGFDRAFHELCRRLGAAGSPESRRNLFLVLVSKTGGREDCVTMLLGLMARHVNEQANVRAAIVRSLVKRARVWRLPHDTWASLLAFAHGLGLDGAPAEAECQEGLHAVILRQLLSSTDCASAVRDAFLKGFSTLSDYSLTADERSRVVDGLTRLLTAEAGKSEPKIAALHLQRILDVYETHKFRIDTRSGIVPAVKDLANRDLKAAREILSQLYETRAGRKELFLANLELRQDDASYVNVLRHDPSAFAPDRLIKQHLATDDNGRHDGRNRFDRFTQKLSLYFSDNLAATFLAAIKAKISEGPDERLARPLASVIGHDMKTYLEIFDAAKEDVGVKRMSAALRACGHRCRPQLDIDAFELKKIGAKAAATRALVCRNVDSEKYVNKLLSWRRTVRAAIVLAQRNRHEAEAFATAAKIRPLVAIKTALPYFRRRGDKADPEVWEIVKPLILALEVAPRTRIHETLNCVKSMPSAIRHDYCLTLFWTLIKNPKNSTMMTLHEDLQNALPYLNRESIEKILLILLEKTDESIQSYLYPSISIRYLLLCKSEEDQIIRYDKIGRPFLERVEALASNDKNIFREYLKLILMSLQYSRVCFDTGYVSCLPVLEKVVVWMQNKLPMEDYFNEYAQIHLTMLYFKTVRQSIQEMPEVFQDSKRKMDEGVDIVGDTFGKNIAKELKDLMSRYFDSIVEIYRDSLVNYLNHYFEYCSSKYKFIRAVIKGMIVGSVGSEVRLAVYIIRNQSHVIDIATSEEIKEIVSEKGEEAKLLYAGL